MRRQESSAQDERRTYFSVCLCALCAAIYKNLVFLTRNEAQSMFFSGVHSAFIVLVLCSRVPCHSPWAKAGRPYSWPDITSFSVDDSGRRQRLTSLVAADAHSAFLLLPPAFDCSFVALCSLWYKKRIRTRWCTRHPVVGV
jgi:hypothetical protein